MELREVRVGNIVKEHDYSSRGRGLLEGFYRVEYSDLGYHNFMVGIPITLEWCKKLKMDIEERIHPSGNYDWIANCKWSTCCFLHKGSNGNSWHGWWQYHIGPH